jgi:DNA polymerase-3 subunit alpha
MEAMPGLIIDAVKADRETDVGDKFLRVKIIALAQEYRKCTGCNLSGLTHPAVRCKSTVKFMVITDCPTRDEAMNDKLMVGDGAAFTRAAIQCAGLNVTDGYYTTLVKAQKNEKFLTNGQINGCKKFIDRELELVKPAVIVALGASTIRYFVPGSKPQEMAGRAIYDPKLDATIVCGINPVQCVFAPEKAEVLAEVFRQVSEILN